MEAAARRLGYSGAGYGFSLPELFRQQATSAVEGIDTKEAFKVRDSTHLALWVSCCVSLGFVLLWFCDVLKLECLKRPWVAEVSGLWRCVFEVVGIFVFVTSFQDSLRVVLNYDSQHQELLQRKQKVLEDVSSGCTEVLHRAQANAENLRSILVDNQIRRVRAHIRDVRANLVPTLVHVSQELSGEEQQAFEQVAGRVIMQMVENLQEPGQLAISLVGNLTEVYGSMQALRNEEEPPIAPPTNELSESQLAQLFPELARAVQTARANDSTKKRPSELSNPDGTFFQYWWTRTLGLMKALRGQRSENSPAEQIMQRKNMKKDVVDHILGPVLAVLEIPELCRRWAAEDPQRFETDRHASQEAWLGCGRPPWDQTSPYWAFQCCVPRVPTLCSWCCPAVLGEEFVQQGAQYPKKFCFAGFWVQIRSQLHERLLFAFCASLVYGICYAFLAQHEVVQGCHGHSFWGCVWEICQSCTALLALMCNVPAIVICLVHMRRIDAMADCECTIRKLEEIQRVVNTFDQRTRTEEQRRVLLEAVDRRVMRRIDLIDRFRSHINRRDVSAEQIADATLRLESCLRGANESLGPATQWLELPANWRERQAQEFEENISTLCNEFDVTKPAEPLLPDAPQLALRVFAQAQQGDSVPLEKTSLRKALSCMRRCRQRRPKQCPPELLQVKGAASYVLVFPAVQWLNMAAQQQEVPSQPLDPLGGTWETVPVPASRENSAETVAGIHEAELGKAADAQEMPVDGEVVALAEARQMVHDVCHAPRVFEKLNESGAYLQRAYKTLVPRQPKVPLKGLQQDMLELVLLYLRYCGCKIKVSRSVDGDQLLVTVRMREEVAKCHASDLGYVLKVSQHLSKLLGLGNAGTEQTVNTFHPYSAHLEECFKDRFGPGRLDLLLKIAMDAPDEFAEDDRSQRGDSDNESVTEVVRVPPPVARAPFPAVLLVTMENHGVSRSCDVDGFYKASKEGGETWPEDWMKEGPPVGETPSYRLLPQKGESPSEAMVSFVESTQMWTHTGNDGAVVYVCPGKKRTEVPTDGWIRPSSKQEMEDGNVVPSYYFDNGPFQAYFGRMSEGSVFRTVDQARLIDTMLREVFNLDEMQKKGFLTTHFVPHQSTTLRFFKDHITAWWHPWHGQWPLEHIREYFGEKCAFQHDFLGFLAGMSLPLAVVAALQFGIPAHFHSRSVFGVFVIVWVGVVQSLWTRREFKHCVDWGMEHCASQPDAASSASQNDNGSQLSMSGIVRFCTFEVPTVLLLWTFAFQWLLHLIHAWLVAAGYTHAVQIQACINVVQMLFMDAVCKAIVPRLLRLQGNLTAKEFDAALMKRTVIYRGIVGYTSLLLGCFLWPLAGMCKADGSCDSQLGDVLEVIFAIRVLTSFVRSAATVRRAKMSFHKPGANSGYEQMKHNEVWQPQSYLEAQVGMPSCGNIETIYDQSEVLIQFGYVLCFGTLRPRIAILFFFISIFRVRAHAWGLLDDNRRPFPEMSQGLGVFNHVLGSLMAFAVLTSSILLALINSDANFVGHMGPHRFLEPYVVAPSGEVDAIRLLLMVVVVKYTLTLLQSVVRPLLPPESPTTVSGRKWRSYLLKQLRDALLGVKDELCEAQTGQEQACPPERLIRDWITGAQQLDMDDEDFEPAAAAKLGKEEPSVAQASA